MSLRKTAFARPLAVAVLLLGTVAGAFTTAHADESPTELLAQVPLVDPLEASPLSEKSRFLAGGFEPGSEARCRAGKFDG